VRVVFTANLHRYTGGVDELEADGATVAELLVALDDRIPGLRHYLVDDRGALRPHVNVFVNGEPVEDRPTLGDPLDAAATVHIMQALSGG